ncbi:MAG: type II toxin-antitoxin system RelE/ParE family toxin [Chthoniobacterales bacterium]
MSFVVRKLPLAEQDALDAAIWYDERQPGLGEEFLDEVDRAVDALTVESMHHRIRFADVRRAVIHRFRFYGIYYVVRGDDVWILAIFHGRRHPRLLQERVTQIG